MCPRRVCHCHCHAMLRSRLGSRVYPTITTEGNFILVKKKNRFMATGSKLQASPAFPLETLPPRRKTPIRFSIPPAMSEWVEHKNSLPISPTDGRGVARGSDPSASLTLNELKLESSGNRGLGLLSPCPLLLLSCVGGPVKACPVGFVGSVYLKYVPSCQAGCWSGLVE